jgi:hypothetical protein
VKLVCVFALAHNCSVCYAPRSGGRRPLPPGAPGVPTPGAARQVGGPALTALGPPAARLATQSGHRTGGAAAAGRVPRAAGGTAAAALAAAALAAPASAGRRGQGTRAGRRGRDHLWEGRPPQGGLRRGRLRHPGTAKRRLPEVHGGRGPGQGGEGGAVALLSDPARARKRLALSLSLCISCSRHRTKTEHTATRSSALCHSTILESKRTSTETASSRSYKHATSALPPLASVLAAGGLGLVGPAVARLLRLRSDTSERHRRSCPIPAAQTATMRRQPIIESRQAGHVVASAVAATDIGLPGTVPGSPTGTRQHDVVPLLARLPSTRPSPATRAAGGVPRGPGGGRGRPPGEECQTDQ